MSDAAPRTPETDVLDSREAGGKVIRGSSLRILAYGGGLLVGLASTPLMVRHLGVEDYGAYQTVTSLILVLAGVTEGGLGDAGGRMYAVRDEAGRRLLMRDMLGLRLALTALAAVAAVVFALAAGYDTRLVNGVLIATAGLFLTNLQATLTLPLHARLRLGWLALLDFLAQLTLAVIVVVLVVVGATLLPFLAAAGITAAVLLAITLVLVRRHVSLRPRFDPAAWRELLAETLLYAAAVALGVLYPKIVILAMSILATAEEVGFYALAMRVFDLVGYIPWLLSATAAPILARAAVNDADRMRYATQRLFDTMIVAGPFVGVGIAFGAPVAVAILGGDDFDPSIGVLRLLAVAVAFTFLVALGSYTLLSLRAFRALLLANATVLVLALVLSGVLIPPFGADGGALAGLLLEAALATLFVVALVRRRPDLRPTAGAAPRAAVALAAAVAAGLLVPGPAVVEAAAAALVYAGVLAAVGGVPAELTEQLRLRRRG